jgi:putative aldouronate transport system substrate-binding protein
LRLKTQQKPKEERRVFKKSLAFIICLALVLSCSTAVSTNVSMAEAASPQGNKLHFISRNRGSASDPVNNDIFQEILKATGLDITWDLWASNNYAAQCSILVASGDYPDAMEYWCSSYPLELDQLSEDGIIMPVDELLTTYGQNIIANRSDELYYTSPIDGLIYGIPCRINKYYSDDTIAIRGDWLEQLGLEVPDSSETLFAAYEAFLANKDSLVGEGKPLTAYGTFGSFGVLLSWISSENGFARTWNVEDDACVYYVNEVGYKQSLLAAREFFQAGFVEPEYVILTRDECFAKLYQNQYASWTFYLGDLDIQQGPFGSAYHNSVPEAVVAPVMPFSDAAGKAHVIGGKNTQMNIIFSNSSNGANAVKLFDYLISDEGQWLTYLGVEGVHYTKNEDGTVGFPDMTDAFKIQMGYRVYDLICHADPYSPAYDPKVFEYADYYKQIGSLAPVDNTATPAYMEFGAALSDLINTNEAQLIITENLDFDAVFDQYIQDWNAQGGAQWTQEVNALYQQNQ